MSDNDTSKTALKEHDKEVDCFLRERDRKWSTATPEQQDQKKREFVALLQRGARLMPGGFGRRPLNGAFVVQASEAATANARQRDYGVRRSLIQYQRHPALQSGGSA